jgi:hypothetical protein
MREGRKNASKTVTCQIDDLRLVAGNVICLGSAGFKIRLAGCNWFSIYFESGAAQRILCCGGAQNSIVI